MYFFCEKSKLWFLNSLTIKKDKTLRILSFCEAPGRLEPPYAVLQTAD